MALTFDAPGCREPPPGGISSPRLASPVRPLLGKPIEHPGNFGCQIGDPRSSPFDERARRFRGLENAAEGWAAHSAMGMMPKVAPPGDLMPKVVPPGDLLQMQGMSAGAWQQQGQAILVTPRVTLAKIIDTKPKDGEPDATPKRSNGREAFKDFGCVMHEAKCDTFNQERTTDLSVLDAKPMECEVICATSSLPALPNRSPRMDANTPRRSALSLEESFRARAEKADDSFRTKAEKAEESTGKIEPDSIHVRSMIEDVVNLKVGLIMADWHGQMKALREELTESSARLQQEIQRMSVSREQLGAGLEGTVERLTRLEEVVQNRVTEQQSSPVIRNSDNGTVVHFCEAAEKHQQSFLHEKLNRLQDLISEHAEASSSVARVSEAARGDLDARSPSPGGRSAKLEAARASRHGCAAPVSRRSQGGSVAAEAVLLARRMSTAASCAGQHRSCEHTSAAVTAVGCMQPAIGATQPSGGSISGSSYRLSAGKLKRSASELPAQRLPMSPRPGCATVRGGGQTSNGSTDCRQAGLTGSRLGPQTPGVPDVGTIGKRQVTGALPGRRAA